MQMNGKGLESLIPKKANTPNTGAPSHAPQHNMRSAAPHPVQQNTQPSRPHVPSASPAHPHVAQPPHVHAIEKATSFITPSDTGHQQPYHAPAGNTFRTPEKSSAKSGEAVFQIEVDKIRPNPYQPRHEFNQEALQELAQSIREFGILQPLVVTKIVRESESGTQVEYQLIAGERRLMAARIAGLPRVPAIVKHVEQPRAKLELALIENIQRSNLNPLESAKAYARLQDEFNLTQREIAAKMGRSREAVANTMRLLNLPSVMQDALTEGRISESQARVLLSIENPEDQRIAFMRLMEGKVTVRALRETVAKKPHTPAAGTPGVDPEIQYWERRMEEQLGAPVKIHPQGVQGKIVIQYYSEDERRGLLEKLSGPAEM